MVILIFEVKNYASDGLRFAKLRRCTFGTKKQYKNATQIKI